MTDLENRIELSKLLIAHDCMEAIHEATVIMSKLNSHRDDALYRALHDTVVSSYGRAFTEMQPLGRLPKKYSTFDNQDDMKRIHKLLMYFRNKNVGHADFIEGRVRVHNVSAVYEDEDLGSVFRYSISAQTFAPSEIVNVQKTAGWVAGTLQADIHNLAKAVFGDDLANLGVEEVDLLTSEEVSKLREEMIKRKKAKR